MNEPRRTAPELSVLVLSSGDPQALTDLLDALEAGTLDPGRFEVAVVGAPGGLQAALARPRAFAVHPDPAPGAEGGPGAARNRGLALLSAPVVLFLEEGCRPAPDLLETHLREHAGSDGSEAVLGALTPTAEALRHPLTRALEKRDLLFPTSRLADGERYGWRFFRAANLSVARERLEAVGGFDADLCPRGGGEDRELGWRLEERGLAVRYVEAARCETGHVWDAEAYFERAVALGRNLYACYREHGDPAFLGQGTSADIESWLRMTLDTVEATRDVRAQLVEALEKLDAATMAGGYQPQVDQVAKPVEEIASACVARGVHTEAKGVDPVEVAERGAPTGGTTAVIVVSYDARERTQRCIEALREARDERRPIEIVVCDNGSTDGSAEWLAAQPDVHLIANPTNEGAPRARNLALAHVLATSSPDWVAFLDNDVFVTPGWLDRALYHGAADPDVGTVCLVANRACKSQVVDYDGGDSPAELAAFADARAAAFHRRGAETSLFTSLGVLVRREVLERIGGFDERFSPWGFEDDDFSLRVLYAGWRNRVALDAFVFHAHYPTAAKQAKHDALLTRNWRAFAEKWGTGAVPPYGDFDGLDLAADRVLTEVELVVPLEAAPAPATEPARTAACGDGRHSVLVVGSGRSGTSMVAGTLAAAGWYVGDEPYPGRDANPKGFFETAEINGINEALLEAALGRGPAFGPGQWWLAELPGALSVDPTEDVAARIRSLAERRPFAFKDPRFCATLGAWREHAGPFRVVCVFRDPAATAESIVAECAREPYLAGVEMDFDRALGVWTSMYARVLETESRSGEWLFVHAEDLLTPEGLGRLEAFVGGPVDRSFPEARLQRTRSTRAIPAEAARIYAELCARAGRAMPTGAPAAELPEPAVARSAGRALGTDLTVVGSRRARPGAGHQTATSSTRT